MFGFGGRNIKDSNLLLNKLLNLPLFGGYFQTPPKHHPYVYNFGVKKPFSCGTSVETQIPPPLTKTISAWLLHQLCSSGAVPLVYIKFLEQHLLNSPSVPNHLNLHWLNLSGHVLSGHVLLFVNKHCITFVLIPNPLG